MCCCCHPETNWYDEFDGSQLNRCYWMRRVGYVGGVFGDRFYRPDNGSRYALEDGMFDPPDYYIDHPSAPHTQQRTEYLYRPFRFFKDADFEINLEIGVDNFGTSEQINLYFGSQFFNLFYMRGIRRMSRAGTGGSYNHEYTDSSPPTSFTIGLKLQIFGSPSTRECALRYYFDGVEHTDWNSPRASGEHLAYSSPSYEYHRDTPFTQHAGAEFATLVAPDTRVFCKYSHFKLTSALL